jgi:hypothetical protein
MSRRIEMEKKGRENFFQRQKSLKRNREKMMMMMFETEIMRQS